jgi:hypothetical protein
MLFPEMFRAPCGQAETHAPQFAHRSRHAETVFSVKARAPFGQLAAQRPHLAQAFAKNSSSGARLWDSGLLHQVQARGQPLKKTVERTPGPS